jgi:hypothetical protein
MRKTRLAVLALLALVAAFMVACESGGIGVGLPASGARWGSGGGGPDVFVGGGPSY